MNGGALKVPKGNVFFWADDDQQEQLFYDLGEAQSVTVELTNTKVNMNVMQWIWPELLPESNRLPPWFIFDMPLHTLALILCLAEKHYFSLHDGNAIKPVELHRDTAKNFYYMLGALPSEIEDSVYDY